MVAPRALNEKCEAIVIFGEANRNYHEAVRMFNERFPDHPIDRHYFKQLVAKFYETGSVQNKPRSGRSITGEDKQVDIMCEFVNNPSSSSRTVALNCEVSQMTVLRILKKNKFHPYKIKMVHELTDDDPDRRLEYCEIVSNNIVQNPSYLKHICFSDEATFFLNGHVHRQNVRYWSDENPRLFRETHTQFPQKVNVWAGILGDHIIGPLFIEENLTGALYLEMLETVIDPLIVATVENNPDEFDMDIILQQDGAPPHFAVAVRTYLNTVYAGRWIGRRGSVEWPPRSPDLTPLDFFLWGYLKSKVYETQCHSIQELRARITEVCATITRDTLQSVRTETQNRLYFCQEVNGEHFEHLLS